MNPNNPNSIEITILAACLSEIDKATKVFESFNQKNFQNTFNKTLFKIMDEIFSEYKEVDIKMIRHRLKKVTNIEITPEWESHLNLLQAEIVSNQTFNSALAIFNEQIYSLMLKDLIKKISKIEKEGDNFSHSQYKIEKELLGFINNPVNPNTLYFKKASTEIETIIDTLNSQVNKNSQLKGLSSGFYKLDRLTNGFQNGDFIVIAARPSMGKTALALSIASNIAINQKKNIVFISLEMSSHQLLNRILSSKSMVDSMKISSAQNLTSDELNRINAIAAKFENTNFWIDDSPGLSLSNLKIKIRNICKIEKIDMIIIDYLQLLVHNLKGENRQQEVTEISQSLKYIAREFNIPVVALSQLSRGVEKRENKKPIMSDLRESGAIEQDADLIMFLYRPDYYSSSDNNEDVNVCEVNIAKHRNGPTGRINLSFIKKTSSFENLE